MDTLEELAHLYLRLNGCFTIPNYILHQPGPQRGEVDVVAVRFPHKLEEVRRRLLKDDPALHLCDDRVEVLMVEVGRNKADFNEPWKRQETWDYVVTFVGCLEDDSELRQASRALAALAPYDNGRIRIRPLLCTDDESVTEDPRHRHLQGMLKFVLQRFRCHRNCKADHEQWQGTLADYIYGLAVPPGSNIKLQDLERGYLEYKRKRGCA